MLDAIESLKEKMVLVCKVLQKQRMVDVYGHLSVRLPDEPNGEMAMHTSIYKARPDVQCIL